MSGDKDLDRALREEESRTRTGEDGHLLRAAGGEGTRRGKGQKGQRGAGKHRRVCLLLVRHEGQHGLLM